MNIVLQLWYLHLAILGLLFSVEVKILLIWAFLMAKSPCNAYMSCYAGLENLG